MSKQEGNGLVRGKDIKGAVVVLSKTQPQQLSLFQTFLPDDERYSNTIDLYDAIPKYFPRKRLKKERVEGMFLPMLKREFEFRGERFVVKITPAKLETREGERDFYPSASSSLDFWVKSFQFHAGIFDAEWPIDAALFGVRLVGPGSDFRV